MAALNSSVGHPTTIIRQYRWSATMYYHRHKQMRLPSRRTIYTIEYTMSWHRTCTDITLLLKISPCHWNLLQYKNRVESLQQITQPTRETWLSCYEWNIFVMVIITIYPSGYPTIYLTKTSTQTSAKLSTNISQTSNNLKNITKVTTS